MHRFQKQVDSVFTDLLAVFNAFFHGVAEMNADENPRQTIFF